MIGIIFDIDDTLYSRRELILRAAKETLREHFAKRRTPENADEHFAERGTPENVDAVIAAVCGETGSAEEEHFMEVFYRYSDENFPQIMAGKITPWQSNVERFVKTVRHLGENVPEEDGVAFADRYNWLQEHIVLSGNLAGIMRDLSACPWIRLGVMTNGTSERQRKKFVMLGLDRFVDPEMVFVSGEIGVSKPDSGIFRAAEERTGLDPGDLWLVGDSVRADIYGAKACGWHTLWLNRGKTDPGKVDTDLVARSEEEMCSLLRDLMHSTACSASNE